MNIIRAKKNNQANSKYRDPPSCSVFLVFSKIVKKIWISIGSQWISIAQQLGQRLTYRLRTAITIILQKIIDE
jgi:hypothetical protein